MYKKFMRLAYVAAKRSTCLRRNVGAILVKNENIIGVGFNGPPRIINQCTEFGCLREAQGIESGTRQEICRAVHAEQRALLCDSSPQFAMLYCTHHPCSICARLLIEADVRKVIYSEGYPDPLAKELFEQAGIPVIQVFQSSKYYAKLKEEAGQCYS